MLGLSYKIRGDKPGIAMLGQHNHLSWTGKEVNSAIERDLLLCCGYVKIARPNNLVDPWHRLSAVGQSGNGLSATDAVKLADAEETGSGECFGYRSGRYHANIANSSDLCRNYGHEQGRRQGVPPPRDVTAS